MTRLVEESLVPRVGIGLPECLVYRHSGQSPGLPTPSYNADGAHSLQLRCPMRNRDLVTIMLVPFLFPPAALAEIQSSTGYTLDLSQHQGAAKKAEWPDPDKSE